MTSATRSSRAHCSSHGQSGRVCAGSTCRCGAAAAAGCHQHCCCRNINTTVDISADSAMCQGSSLKVSAAVACITLELSRNQWPACLACSVSCVRSRHAWRCHASISSATVLCDTLNLLYALLLSSLALQCRASVGMSPKRWQWPTACYHVMLSHNNNNTSHDTSSALLVSCRA